jgi:hypothetical protein
MRLLFAALVFVMLAACLALTGPAAAQQPIITTTTISGGGLPHGIRLSPADQDAFLRRLDLPPLLDDVPEVRGPAYTVASPYWDIGVRAGDNTQVLVDDAATYYPEGGFVKTRQQGEDIWTALDTTQRTILDRYIRLAPVLPPEPSAFEVLRAAGLDGEEIGISIGSVLMTKEQRTKFWANARDLKPQPGAASRPFDASTPGITWIEFTLPEGRSIPMAYSSAAGTLVAPGEAAAVFAVPRDWLVPVLGAQAENAPSDGLQPLSIPQDATDGSPLWWLVTIGGGIASIAIAVLLDRKLRNLRATTNS